jgi:universal stress protein A
MTTRRILHPSDFSSASRPAFARAVEMAKSGRAELVILHVLAPMIPLAGEGYISPTTYDQLTASAERWAKKRLDALVARARAAGVRAAGVLAEGVAHEQIVRAAKARKIGTIVMGTHGRSGVARLFVGSVASRVVASAPCPVLTVRGT